MLGLGLMGLGLNVVGWGLLLADERPTAVFALLLALACSGSRELAVRYIAWRIRRER